jgi:Ca2+-binding EF-hand superfamily protein
MPPSPVIAALDTDKDGTISAEEIEKAVASLKTLDKNNDGKLTPEELRPQGGPGGPGGPGGFGGGAGGGFNPEQMVARIFEESDKDGDGKLSADEAPERMQANFERIDADSDGFVTKEEFQTVIARMREGGPRGEGGPRAPRDGEGGPRGPRDGESGPRGPQEEPRL